MFRHPIAVVRFAAKKEGPFVIIYAILVVILVLALLVRSLEELFHVTVRKISRKCYALIVSRYLSVDKFVAECLIVEYINAKKSV